ncbi:hypothetical protein AA0119_g13296 [Alternaria tenuissima]|uniref:Transcription factor domain-containing protein n=2 Tax=Alternaria alternata complex TaxID=187734 RepID=A0A4Q4MVU5_ALTAL|nr:hypothetical protein AA0117_g13094 [Alternaria alternata]RYN85212.1 hypothetical protein AA0119_g13296 [Alternaria tenuissima]RYO00914.1 hypothetical protein AA0121_g13339 [Alternaria tenuissima]
MLDWLDLDYDGNLRQYSTAQLYGLLGADAHNGSAKCTLSLLPERMVADKAEAKPLLNHRMYGLTALCKNADRGSRRQQAVWEKIEVLLSSKHQTCVSDLLRKVDSSGEHQSLDLTSLPIEKLVQRAFRELGGLNLFIKEKDVTCIQERFLDPEKLPVDVSDMSLLITSLAWGASLDPEVSSASKVALLDAVLEASTLLLRQNGSVRKFLALVAVLCLAEKTGSDNLPALILGSISTAASLSLHLETALRKFCVSNEQAVQTKRAMRILYCIDKSYALRWQTFSLVGDGSLPTTNPPDTALPSDVATTLSLEWLRIRSQYSKICSNILQLGVGAEGELSENRSNRAVALSTALEEWYGSVEISQMMLSLEHSDAVHMKLQTSYHYYEARFQLLTISLPDPRSSSPTGSQECKEVLRRSIREVITGSNTIASEYLLQDCNHLFIQTLALSMLALDILLESDQGCGKENRALLSIVAGFFARVDIILPQSSIFEEVSNLIEILTYR